jgi:hypothetical protein
MGSYTGAIKLYIRYISNLVGIGKLATNGTFEDVIKLSVAGNPMPKPVKPPKRSNMNPKTDREKVQNILDKLSTLPYFTPKKVTEHLELRIRHLGAKGEVAEMQYRIISDVKHNQDIRDKIVKAIRIASQQINILVVTAF